MTRQAGKTSDPKLQQVIRERNDAKLRINELEAQLHEYQNRGTGRQIKDLLRHIARTLRSIIRKALEQKPAALLPYNDGSLHYSETTSMDVLLRLARQTDRANFMLSKPPLNDLRRVLQRVLGFSYRLMRDSLKAAYRAVRPQTGERS